MELSDRAKSRPGNDSHSPSQRWVESAFSTQIHWLDRLYKFRLKKWRLPTVGYANVGAGASGVLLAHYLLRRGDRYQVDLYDRLSDPRITEFYNTRTFPISLTKRGMKALGRSAGLETAVRAIGLEMSGTIFYQPNGKTRVKSRKKPLVTLDRTNLVITLLDELTQKYANSRLNLHFDRACTAVDFAAKTITFRNTAQTSAPTATDLTVNKCKNFSMSVFQS